MDKKASNPLVRGKSDTARHGGVQGTLTGIAMMLTSSQASFLTVSVAVKRLQDHKNSHKGKRINWGCLTDVEI